MLPTLRKEKGTRFPMILACVAVVGFLILWRQQVPTVETAEMNENKIVVLDIQELKKMVKKQESDIERLQMQVSILKQQQQRDVQTLPGKGGRDDWTSSLKQNQQLGVPKASVAKDGGLRGRDDEDQADWKLGLVVGDGEVSTDSYHTFDHRPPTFNDGRDNILRDFEIVECPNQSQPLLVSGQDVRYESGKHMEYKERNPKFLCGIDKLQSPCVMYSFGSWDEISYEVGFDRITQSACDVHVFDPSKIPDADSAKRYNFHTHHYGVGSTDTMKEDGETIQTRTVQTIMSELKHTKIDVFKIDIEGYEEQVLPSIMDVYPNIGQISIEFHSLDYLRTGMKLLTDAGFVAVFARREDRCNVCVEVTLVNTKWNF